MDKIYILLLVVCIWSRFSIVKSKYNHCSFFKSRLAICPDIQVVSPGSNVSLICPLKGVSYDFYRIPRHRPIVSDNNKYKVSGNNLTITNVLFRDNGMYICEAKNRSGDVTKHYWILSAVTLKPRPAAAVKPGGTPTTELLVGSKKVFDCHRRNKVTHLLFSVSDDVDNAHVLSARNGLMSNNGIFQFSNLDTSHSGYYYCASANLHVWKHLGNLAIRDPPRISRKSKVRLVSEGKTVRFTCKFSGPQEIAWYKNGKKLNASLSKKDGTNTKLLKLLLKNVNEADAGDYNCSVTVGRITAKQTARLDVFVFKHAAVLAMGALPKHSQVSINCQSNSRSASYAILHKRVNTKNFITIKIDRNKYIEFHKRSGLFLITNLNQQDEGEYMCEAQWGKMVIRKTAGKIVLQ